VHDILTVSLQMKHSHCLYVLFVAFCVLILLVGRQEWHLACKKLMMRCHLVICLKQGAEWLNGFNFLMLTY